MIIMIKAIINKKEDIFPEGTTVEDLLKHRNNKRASVWVNGRQLLKAEFPEYEIKEGDQIKILRILAGG